MTLSEELKAKLIKKGASFVGFADLSVIPEKDRARFKNGIIFGIAVRPEIILGIHDGPTMEYYREYNRINKLLNEIGEYTENLLIEKGFNALAKTQKVVVEDEGTRRTELPHKTVATRAGIGWIGKCALLVTEEFGSAVRITSVLTNAELETGQPINESKCGTCTACKEVCPAGAVSGELWEVSKDRDQFYNAFDCRKKARERSAKIGLEMSLCGLCILHCPWTQAYLKR
ncbi:MAG TPA: 4Fe-4S double cluster binding domain-containing protein [Clostridia bacterium]|nr:4Fe-4S double cluster binding domain-containing protein [Clostridia bacterium]